MNKKNQRIRVLIADDHHLIRRGIRQILEQQADIEVVAEAIDGEEAQRLTLELKPDILLLDLVMPGPQPDEISRWVRRRCPQIEILILTGHAHDAFLCRMMEAGAMGFLDKNEAPDLLLESIRRVVLGQVMFSPDQVRRAQRWRAMIGKHWEQLTEREQEVLEWMVQGLGNQAIADVMVISLSTVRSHNRSIFDKLGAKSRSEAIAFVLHNHLLD
ncbi:MAG: response regulator transcription factor [Chloroflexi bacterium]|nr:response regulator transcription factor [Chloroflexota bacterium]